MPQERSPHPSMSSRDSRELRRRRLALQDINAQGHMDFQFEDPSEDISLPKRLRTDGSFRKKKKATRAFRIVLPKGSLLTSPFVESAPDQIESQADIPSVFDIASRIQAQDSRYMDLASCGLLTEEWKKYGQRRGFVAPKIVASQNPTTHIKNIKTY